MPPTDRLLTFLLASFVLIVIPGPSVLFTIGRALSAGRRGGLLSVAGNATGVFAQVLGVAVGVGPWSSVRPSCTPRSSSSARPT